MDFRKLLSNEHWDEPRPLTSYESQDPQFRDSTNKKSSATPRPRT